MVHAVKHGLAVPILRRSVPTLKFTTGGFRYGDRYAGVFHTGLLVFCVIASRQKDGEVVWVLPCGSLVVLCCQFHAFAFPNPAPVQGRNHRRHVFLHPQVFLGRPADQREQGVNHIDGFYLVKATKLSQCVLPVRPGEGHGRFHPRHLKHADTGLMRRWLLVHSSDDRHIVAPLSEVARQVEHHGANPPPAGRIFARDHGDVHGSTTENHHLKFIEKGTDKPTLPAKPLKVNPRVGAPWAMCYPSQ